jgi:hypothetical protein
MAEVRNGLRGPAEGTARNRPLVRHIQGNTVIDFDVVCTEHHPIVCI